MDFAMLYFKKNLLINLVSQDGWLDNNWALIVENVLKARLHAWMLHQWRIQSRFTQRTIAYFDSFLLLGKMFDQSCNEFILKFILSVERRIVRIAPNWLFCWTLSHTSNWNLDETGTSIFSLRSSFCAWKSWIDETQSCSNPYHFLTIQKWSLRNFKGCKLWTWPLVLSTKWLILSCCTFLGPLRISGLFWPQEIFTKGNWLINKILVFFTTLVI